MSDCLFCKIVAGEIPSNKAGESELAYAFYDIAPQAPVHVLVVPKAHITSASHVQASDAETLADMFALAQAVARDEGVAESGFRLAFNDGVDAQMTVPHLHMHLLGGRRLEWPPG